MGNKIDIYEVGPRDGFQNVTLRNADDEAIAIEEKIIPTAEKKKIIDMLVESGLKHIEFTSFVSPKAIPQLMDAKEVTKYVLEKYPQVDFFALIPNLKGAQLAYEMGLRRVCYVVSMSKSHNQANIRRTHEESLAAYKEIREDLPDLDLILDLATAFGCPFEGKVNDWDQPVRFLKDYVDLGVKSVCLCDTVGLSDPAQVVGIIERVKKAYPDLDLMVHIHDTRGNGLASTLAAISAGVTKVQSTLGGLGGCPFAPGASGNLSTEDTVWTLNEMGYDTGVDFSKILVAAKYEKGVIKGNYSGHHISIEKETPCRKPGENIG